MKEITGIKDLPRNLRMYVDEKQVHFINGLAAVKAVVIDEDYKEKYACAGVINEEYQEAFDNDYERYGRAQNLMLCRFNQDIIRCGENDFIVTVLQGDWDWSEHIYKHIRINGMKATVVNDNIGPYQQTANSNLLITGYRPYDKRLYDITAGKHIGGRYAISPIEGDPDHFTAIKKITSLPTDGSTQPKDPNAYLSDTLYFQIDQNGHIVSRIYSKRKLAFLDYEGVDIDDYPKYCQQELIEESKKLEAAIHSLKSPQN